MVLLLALALIVACSLKDTCQRPIGWKKQLTARLLSMNGVVCLCAAVGHYRSDGVDALRHSFSISPGRCLSQFCELASCFRSAGQIISGLIILKPEGVSQDTFLCYETSLQEMIMVVVISAYFQVSNRDDDLNRASSATYETR